MFPSEQFDVSKVSDNDSLKSVKRVVRGGVATPYSSISLEDFGKFQGNDLFSSNLGLCQNKMIKECQKQLTVDCQGLDYAYLDVVAQPSQSTEDIRKFPSFNFSSMFIKPGKEIPSSLDFLPFKILKEFTNKSRNMNGRRIRVPSYKKETKVMDDSVSTTAIISLAGEKVIRSFSQKVDDLSRLCNPLAVSFMGLSDETSRDIEIVQDLLVCAEKVAQNQFDCSSELILQCNKLSSKTGSPVRRLTNFFSAALLDKIKNETGGIKSGTGKAQILDCRDELISANPNIIAFHQKVPFSQVSLFTAIQTIAENVRGARGVHIIDTDIRIGVQHIVLMQALAVQSQGFPPQLKITAIGTRSKAKIEETGKNLKSFAESMNLLFSFNVLMVADFLDLSIDHFQLDEEEEVAVYSSYFLKTLISRPDRLDNFMSVMRKIKPSVIVMCEVEANHTTPAFMNRFIEALFYFGAFFDALANCMADSESNRRVLESEFGLMINNIVAAEGTERIIRHINIDVWRAHFSRLGLTEADLSRASEYQANLLLKNFNCGSSCTIDRADKCLVVGWKGAPIFSVSAWKFL